MPSASAADEQEPAPLRVMTFNIRFNNPADKGDAWPHRKELVASMIRFHRPDAVGLQEALVGQLEDLDALLPDYGRCGVGRDDGAQAGEHAAILYRRDRLKLLRSATFWYSDTPEEASDGWDNNRRIATCAHLQDSRGGGRFWLYNTHFGFTEKHRALAPPLLRQRIRERPGGGPVVLLGDFNMLADSQQYQAVTLGQNGNEPPLRDAMRITRTPHHGPTGTWCGFRKIEPGRRIDFIFVTPGVDILRHAALSDTFDGRFPSDHLPVVADVLLGQ